MRRKAERSLHVRQAEAFELLQEYGFPISRQTHVGGVQLLLAVTVDRSAFSPCLILGKYKDNENLWPKVKKLSLKIDQLDECSVRVFVETFLNIREGPSLFVSRIVKVLVQLFKEKEASNLELRLSCNNNKECVITKAYFEFDDATYKVAKRHEDIHSMKSAQARAPEEIEAEKDGIVYIKYDNLIHLIQDCY